MREAYSLNGGESGAWYAEPDETQPILAPAHLSDSDIDALIARITETPEPARLHNA